jgi:dihydroorotase-like cyclic amidohydrolase
VGMVADLTMFSNEQNTFLTKQDSKSKSANSPFWDLTLNAKVMGTYVKGKLNLNS